MQQCPLLALRGARDRLAGQRGGETPAEEPSLVSSICSGSLPPCCWLSWFCLAWEVRGAWPWLRGWAELLVMVCLAVQVLLIFATRGSLRLIFREQHNVQKALRLHLLKTESSVFRHPQSLLKILSVCCWLPDQVSAQCSQWCILHHCSLSPVSGCQCEQRIREPSGPKC